jgi:hypothetical protein
MLAHPGQQIPNGLIGHSPCPGIQMQTFGICKRSAIGVRKHKYCSKPQGFRRGRQYQPGGLMKHLQPMHSLANLGGILGVCGFLFGADDCFSGSHSRAVLAAPRKTTANAT